VVVVAISIAAAIEKRTTGGAQLLLGLGDDAIPLHWQWQWWVGAVEQKCSHQTLLVVLVTDDSLLLLTTLLAVLLEQGSQLELL
jgi:hypothetical protein